MPALPPRPLRIAPRFLLGWTAAALGAAALAGWILSAGASTVLRDWLRIREAREVWSSGVSARAVQAIAVPRSRSLILTHYEIDLFYTDENDTRRQKKAVILLPFKRVAADDPRSLLYPGPPPEVRYDPLAPDRYAVSWEMAADPAREPVLGVMLLTALAFSAAAGLVAYLAARRLLRVLRVASGSREVALAVIGVSPAPAGSWLHVVVPAGRGAPERERRVHLPGGQEPMYASPDRRSVVALLPLGRPGAPVVPRASGWPFVL